MSNQQEKMLKGYNVALHSISASESSREKAEGFLRGGLPLNSSFQSIRATSIQLGDIHRNKHFRDEYDSFTQNYRYRANSEGYNIIIMSPTILKNSQGEMLFLGDPFTGIREEDLASSGQQYQPTCILDIVCRKLEGIPSEFIYGYTDPNSGEVIKNANHYSQKAPEEIDQLFDAVNACLDEPEKQVSKAIASGDKQALDRLENLFQMYHHETFLSIIDKAKRDYGEIEKQSEDHEP